MSSMTPSFPESFISTGSLPSYSFFPFVERIIFFLVIIIIDVRCALVNTFEHSYQTIFGLPQLNIIDYSFEFLISQFLDSWLGNLVGLRDFCVSTLETSKSSDQT
jgi:hypothetical protein